MANKGSSHRTIKFSMRAERHRQVRVANRLRDESRVKLAPQDQLEALDFRLGRGVGAKRERAKLARKLAS
jgi:hypothetical protein